MSHYGNNRKNDVVVKMRIVRLIEEYKKKLAYSRHIVNILEKLEIEITTL